MICLESGPGGEGEEAVLVARAIVVEIPTNGEGKEIKKV